MVKEHNLPFPEGMVFDLDGCIANTLPAIGPAVNRLRAVFNMSSIPIETIRIYMGVPLKIFIGRVMTDCMDPPMKDPEVIQAQQLYVGFYIQAIGQHAQVYPGIPEVLEYLLEHSVNIAVCTNKSQDLALKTLEAVELDKYFNEDLVVGGDTLPHAKPHPVPLKHLICQFQTIPQKVWMVGDSSSDILVARAAGCVSIGCSYGYGDFSSYEPDAIIDEPKQLLMLLGSE